LSEPFDCLQLLAISVIQHRTKNGFLTLGKATASLRFSATREDEMALEELLKLLAESADGEGQRNHARLTQRIDENLSLFYWYRFAVGNFLYGLQAGYICAHVFSSVR
jgi:hypothetical protein